MQKITPFLWFNDNAEEAAKFYTSIFENSKIGVITHYDEVSATASGRPKGSVMTAAFQLNGQDFVALNGVSLFKFSDAISFFVYCESDERTETIHNKLIDGGTALMPLGKYDWSPKYAWIKDKFGLSWQLTVEKNNSSQKILPSLLFVNEKFSKVKEAINFYTSVFSDSRILLEAPYPPSENNPKDALLFAQFNLSGFLFNSMSGGTLKHDFDFNDSISFVVNCDTQDEIDHYWKKLSAFPQAEMCGWLKDKFGVSWQVIPAVLNKLLTDKDGKKSQSVMKTMLQMKKINIAELEKAYNN